MIPVYVMYVKNQGFSIPVFYTAGFTFCIPGLDTLDILFLKILRLDLRSIGKDFLIRTVAIATAVMQTVVGLGITIIKMRSIYPILKDLRLQCPIIASPFRD